MRKLYIVLISCVVLAFILAYQATYSTKEANSVPGDQVGNNLQPNEEVIPANRQENIVPSNEVVQDSEPRYYERGSQMVDGQLFILLQIYKRNFPEERRIVQLKNNEYSPLGQKYNWVEEYINAYVTDFWFMEGQSQLYLLRYKVGEFDYENPEFSELVLIDYSDTTNIKSSVIETFKNGIYESKSFAGFNPKENSFVIVTGGGDGCGGWGDVITYNLETKVINLLKEIGSGCNDKERYFTFHDGKLIMGKTVECSAEAGFDENYCLSEIYALNPFNLTDRNTIRTFAKPYLYDAGYLYGEDKPRLTSQEIILFKAYKNGKGDNYRNSRTIETYIYDIETGKERLIPNK